VRRPCSGRATGGGLAAGRALRAHCLPCGRGPLCRRPARRGASGLPREGPARRSSATLATKGPAGGAPSCRGRGSSRRLLPRGLPCPARGQGDPGLPRFRQADRDRLLRRSRAVLALADVMNLLANELARLRRGSLATLPVPSRSRFHLSLWHGYLRLCPPAALEGSTKRARTRRARGLHRRRTSRGPAKAAADVRCRPKPRWALEPRTEARARCAARYFETEIATVSRA